MRGCDSRVMTGGIYGKRGILLMDMTIGLVVTDTLRERERERESESERERDIKRERSKLRTQELCLQVEHQGKSSCKMQRLKQHYTTVMADRTWFALSPSSITTLYSLIASV